MIDPVLAFLAGFAVTSLLCLAAISSLHLMGLI